MTAPVVAALDIGGTRLKLGVVTASGEVVHTAVALTQAQSPGLLERVGDLLEQVIASHRPAAIGVATAGLVNPHTGDIIGGARNLPGWAGTALGEALERRLGLPVAADNDGNAAAWGEHWLGAGQGVQNLLMLMVGTGLGVGLILNGAIYHGAYWGGLNLSYEAVPGVPRGYYPNPHAGECSIGEGGLRWQIREALSAGQHTILDPDQFSIATLHDAGARADALALHLLAQQNRALSAVLANAVQMLDPERVLLGGGVVAAGGEAMFEAVRHQTIEWLNPHHRRHFDLRPAELGGLAGVYGAARLAWGRLG